MGKETLEARVDKLIKYKTFEDLVVLTFLNKYSIAMSQNAHSSEDSQLCEFEKKIECRSYFWGVEEEGDIYNIYTYTKYNLQIEYCVNNNLSLFFIEGNKKKVIIELRNCEEVGYPLRKLEGYVKKNIDIIIEEYKKSIEEDIIFWEQNGCDSGLDFSYDSRDDFDPEEKGLDDLYEYYYK